MWLSAAAPAHTAGIGAVCEVRCGRSRHTMRRMRTALLAAALLLGACSTTPHERTTMHALRLLPGQDVRAELQRYVDAHDIEAGWVASCAGSLTDFHLRYADQPSGTTGHGHFEIVSLSGTLSKNGSHLHLAIADEQGRTLGGHLLEGCRVYTTAEIVLGASSQHVFVRKRDGSTPWEELQIRNR